MKILSISCGNNDALNAFQQREAVARRRSMISKSKVVAIAFVAAMGLVLQVLASPAFAISSNSPALTGGGSLGHNRLQQAFRLKQHPGKPHAQHQHATESNTK
jgi:hypothetical protein